MRQFNPIYPSIHKIQDPNSEKIKWISVDKNILNNKAIKNESITATATVMPSNAINKRLLWHYIAPNENSKLKITSLDRNHLKVNIFPEDQGIYYITCQSTDGSNINYTFQLVVSNSEGENFIPITNLGFSINYKDQVENIYDNESIISIIQEENSYIYITPIFSPEEATYKVCDYGIGAINELGDPEFLFNLGWYLKKLSPGEEIPQEVLDLYNNYGTKPENFEIVNQNNNLTFKIPISNIYSWIIGIIALDGSAIYNLIGIEILPLYVAIENILIDTPEKTDFGIEEEFSLKVESYPENASDIENIQLSIDPSGGIEQISKSLENNRLTFQLKGISKGEYSIKAYIQENENYIYSNEIKINIKKMISSMTDEEIKSHLEERRYENLLDESHFESIDQISEFIQGRDYHDIFIGDYFTINIPWFKYNNYNISTSGNYSVIMRIVDINYLLDKNAGISKQHLILMPDKIVGIGPMTTEDSAYNEIIQISSRSYGFGYYNNYMINSFLPKVLNKFQEVIGANHILGFTDQLPIYYNQFSSYSNFNSVIYKASNNYIRIPNEIVLTGKSITDNNSIWNEQFRLYNTNNEYVNKQSNLTSTNSFWTSDINYSSSSIYQGIYYITRQNYNISQPNLCTSIYGICPIIVFG